MGEWGGCLARTCQHRVKTAALVISARNRPDMPVAGLFDRQRPFHPGHAVPGN